jgi:hypothetical protein
MQALDWDHLNPNIRFGCLKSKLWIGITLIQTSDMGASNPSFALESPQSKHLIWVPKIQALDWDHLNPNI